MRLGRIQNNYTAEGFDIALRGQNEFIEPHSITWRGELGDAGVAFTHKFIRQFMI